MRRKIIVFTIAFVVLLAAVGLYMQHKYNEKISLFYQALENNTVPSISTFESSNMMIHTGSNYSLVWEAEDKHKVYIDKSGNVFHENFYRSLDGELYISRFAFYIKMDGFFRDYRKGERSDKYIETPGYSYKEDFDIGAWGYVDMDSVFNGRYEWNELLPKRVISSVSFVEETNEVLIYEVTINNDENLDFSGILSIINSDLIPDDRVKIETKSLTVIVSKELGKIIEMNFNLDYYLGDRTRYNGDVITTYSYEDLKYEIVFPVEYGSFDADKYE